MGRGRSTLPRRGPIEAGRQIADPEAIERLAEDLLANLPSHVWDGRRPPIPVEDIVDSCFGLHVSEHPPTQMAAATGAPILEDQATLSGLLFPGERRIWVNSEEARQWPGRRRFTIGHELGHFLMHTEKGGGQPVFCRHATVDPTEDQEETEEESDYPSIEAEANAFAAALLMPRELMRETYERLRLESDCHAQMCKLFGASGAAMGHRLHAVI